jgi:hypothetical protein
VVLILVVSANKMYQFVSGLTKKPNIKSCLRPIRTNESLLLLGDCFELYGSNIDKSRYLLKHVSETWNKVYVVPGQTEICGNGLRSWIRNMDDFTEFLQTAPKNNVVLLNNSEIHDGDNLLVGSTFWAGAPPNYEIIRKHPQLVEKYLDSWSQEDAAFIGNAIKMATCQKKTLRIATYFGYKTIKYSVADPFFDSITGIKDTRYTEQSCSNVMKTLQELRGGWVHGLKESEKI